MQNKPAYPVPGQHSGLSMRDWFAGMALQGLLTKYFDPVDVEAIVIKSYEIADEMVKQQAKQE